MKIIKFILPALFALAVLAGGAWAYFNWEINRPSGLAQKTAVVIEPGDSVKKIAQVLEEQGVIRSATFFTFYIRLQGLSTNLQAGRYEILPTFSLSQIAELLQHGTFDVRLTFFEGWRKEQYLNYALEMLAVEDQEFTAQFNSLTKNLEGYLFPDTYIVPVNITAPELVAILRNNFTAKYAQVEEAAKASGLSQKQIVIIASLIERETADDTDSQDEMRTIAGIIMNRLQVPMLLQIDATLQYILGYQKDTGKWWTASSSAIFEAKSIDSPYNTYNPKYMGLPPGPIANPGLDSLLATVNYKRDTPYLFYLHDKDGEIHYARDYAEHQRNIVKYLR